MLLCTKRGNIKSIQEFSQEFDFEVKTMEYVGLVFAIPQHWKRCVKSMRITDGAISNKEKLFLKCNNRLMALQIVTNGDVYWELVTQK